MAGAVLIANQWLTERSGTVVVTADLARGLARRGWRVAVYAPLMGAVAETLQAEGAVELVSDIALASFVPDLIHGHQLVPLLAALARFPTAPALQVCHDAVNWMDAQVPLARVRTHAAVDFACRERVCAELGLAPDETPILSNALDLGRLPPRGPLPQRPARVLIVAHHHGGHVAEVQAACERAGLAHETVGTAAGRPVNDLEAWMARADIVVGAARIALEAMAIGCAALVCDARGLAGMARAADFDAWRGWNFGRRLLTAPVTAEGVGEALATYDADDAAALSARVRAECGLEPAIDRLEALYAEVMAADRRRGPPEAEAEAALFAATLQRWLPLDAGLGP
ncbi:MAG TPA: hypothetical protein VG939_16230, partial [Caulobacteraceae bacterium]|nr:hypothetical protein [Caulobacteraceae bacterium]